MSDSIRSDDRHPNSPGSPSGLGGPDSLLVLGDYWRPDRAERSRIGELVYRAKDREDADAATALAASFSELAGRLGDGRPEGSSGRSCESTGVSACVEPAWRVVAVPPSTGVSGWHLGDVLARALAGACGGLYMPGSVVRRRRTPRMRDLPPRLRPAAAAEAGYRMRADVAGCRVVLVDDVILTGTTIHAITGCLRDAGAVRVVAAVAARTRRDV